MNDREWQQAYNAGRREAEGVAEALNDILKHEGQEVGYAFEDVDNPYCKARTALAKYREGR